MIRLSLYLRRRNFVFVMSETQKNKPSENYKPPLPPPMPLRQAQIMLFDCRVMFWEKRDGFIQPFRESEQEATYFDDAQSFSAKVADLAQLIGRSTSTLAITGTGFADLDSATKRKPSRLEPMSLAAAAATSAMDFLPRGSTPSFEHLSLAQLGVRKIVHSAITTSSDGLQRKAGFPAEALVELHGSAFTEVCTSCGKLYRRDVDVRDLRRQTLPKQTKPSKISWLKTTHETLRECNECGGKLKDEVVRDGEVTSATRVRRAIMELKQARLVVVLGSDLRQSPIYDLVDKCCTTCKLVIVNPKPTAFDKRCDVRLFANPERVLRSLGSKLDLQGPPPYFVKRKIRVWNTYKGVGMNNHHLNEGSGKLREKIVETLAPRLELFVEVFDEFHCPISAVDRIEIQLPKEYAHHMLTKYTITVDEKTHKPETHGARLSLPVEPALYGGIVLLLIKLRGPDGENEPIEIEFELVMEEGAASRGQTHICTFDFSTRCWKIMAASLDTRGRRRSSLPPLDESREVEREVEDTWLYS